MELNFSLADIPPYVIHIIGALLILLVAYIIHRIVKGIIRNRLTKSKADASEYKTNYKFLNNASALLIYTVAVVSILYSVPELRVYGATLFASAGVLTVILGFASQEALSNIVGGVFIVIFKPFRIGDIVEIGTLQGEVEDITLRHTVIKNWENKRIIIPNSTISRETLINWNVGDTKMCTLLDIGISYDSDIDLAKKIMLEEIMAHPLRIDPRTAKDKREGKPEVPMRLKEYADSAIVLRAFVWSKEPFHSFQIKSDLLTTIKKRFDAEGVEIPFPYRTVVFKDKDKDTNKDQVIKGE
jgi:small-conductance mechanosensitive channel